MDFRGKPLNGYPDYRRVRSKPITASIYQVSLLIFCEIPQKSSHFFEGAKVKIILI